MRSTIRPRASLPAKEIRFRLLNGSNARVYRLAFGDGRTFRQIAADTALTETPVPLTTLTLRPGERAEIVADFSAALGGATTLLDAASGAVLLDLAVDRAPSTVTTLPATLTTLTWPDATEAAAPYILHCHILEHEDRGTMGQFIVT